MPLDIHALTYAPLRWNEGLPAVFAGPRLPGSTARHTIGEFGSLSLQEIVTRQYSIRYMTVSPREDFSIRLCIPDGPWHAQLSLDGNSLVRINGNEERLFRRHQFILLDREQSEVVTGYATGSEYHFFDTSMAPDNCEELRSALTEREVQPAWAGSEVLGIVQDILVSKFAQALLLYHYHNRVKDLFLQYVLQWQQQAFTGTDIPTRILNGLHRAEQLISADLKMHFNIPELCRRSGLNAFDLKTYFPVVYGRSPYDYLLRKRMLHARKLLEQGASVKEAAGTIDMRPSNFSVAFFKHFGFHASALLKPD